MCAQQGSRSLSSLRVLMQIRDNALTQRGGDTVVMEKLAEGLRAAGHTVDIDVEQRRNVRDYDIVHLYNFATPDITAKQARGCVEANAPFVVTTMYEDWPYFFGKMIDATMAVAQYIQLGQPRDKWPELEATIGKGAPAGIQDNSYTATHAQALIASGEFEKRSILRDYPQTKRVEFYNCGCDFTPSSDDGELFRKEYGVEDFVLCVGRLETRKNQLMLLKALEDSDLTLVLAAGGFTYQPDYEALCRAMKRRGKTLILGKLDQKMLASAFAAARVHALPSFFELPGLVHLEAANYGKNIIVTDYGTIRDYVGDDAFYCRPEQPESILNAITAAYYSPVRSNLKERVRKYTWTNCVKMNIAIYEKVLSEFGYVKEALGTSDFTQLSRLTSALKGIETAAVQVTTAGATVSAIPKKVGEVCVDPKVKRRAEVLCDEGDRLAKEGRSAEAAVKYREAAAVCGSYARAERSLGVLALAAENFQEAHEHLKLAVMIDADDVRAITGLGVAKWNLGEKEEGFSLLRQSLNKYPVDMPSMLYFMRQCYELGRLEDLEAVLAAYVAKDDNSADMHFCYAGCLFKQRKLRQAEKALERALELDPANAGALELHDLLEKELANEPKEEEKPKASLAAAGIEELQRQKKYDEALEQSAALLAKGETNLADRFLLTLVRGESFACKGDFKAAAEAFASAQNVSALIYRATAGQAVIAAATEQWDEAEKLFNLALQQNGNHDVSHAGLGLCAKRRGDHEEAWRCYQNALRCNPENQRALLGLVELAYPLNRLPELEKALQTYLEFSPANLSFLYAYAGCVYAQGKKELALEQLMKIRLFDPDHELANELLRKIEQETRVRANA